MGEALRKASLLECDLHQMEMEKSSRASSNRFEANRHSNLDDPLYKKCAHGDIAHTQWIDPGTKEPTIVLIRVNFLIFLALTFYIRNVTAVQKWSTLVYVLFAEHTVYEKVKKALTADSLKMGIMQASPHAQTDYLEGFHCPQPIAYKKYIGIYCR